MFIFICSTKCLSSCPILISHWTHDHINLISEVWYVFLNAERNIFCKQVSSLCKSIFQVEMNWNQWKVGNWSKMCRMLWKMIGCNGNYTWSAENRMQKTMAWFFNPRYRRPWCDEVRKRRKDAVRVFVISFDLRWPLAQCRISGDCCWSISLIMTLWWHH